MDNFFAGKKIFVTGGAGFVGANLARRLLEVGADVYVLARKSTDLWRLGDVFGEIEIYFSDLSDFDDIKDLVREIKPQGVFHLGASMMIHGVVLEPEKVMNINYDGTKNLLESISPNCFFINTGSYSDGVGADDFALSKRKSTEYCTEFGKNHKRPVVTLRLFTPYGPFIQKERFVYEALTNAAVGGEIKISSPDITRDFIFVDDLVDLYFAAAEKARRCCGEIFNAGSGVSTTLKEAVDIALEISGGCSEVVWKNSPRLSYDFPNVRADISKNEKLLNWKPKTSLRQGLQKTYDWLKNNLDRY